MALAVVVLFTEVLRTDLHAFPAQIWTCNSFRCGESRLETSLCSCADDCLERKDCCADYKTVCHGKQRVLASLPRRLQWTPVSHRARARENI